MKYKVCILSAGIGSRMDGLSDHINKAILPVNFKATISHIVEKFPEDIEFVIAVGHKKETVIDYLSLAHPDRKITYVEIDKYMGPGTGPGYSLLKCKEYLKCPFVFFTADTMVIEEIPPLDQNWFGIAPVKNTEQYCTVKIKNNLVCQLDDKVKNNNKFAFIGLAGVRDYEDFFSALEEDKKIVNEEIQVSNGFKKLIEKKLVPIGFTWFDTGTYENYTETNKNFSGEEEKFDFSKGKGDEFLYFVNDRVIKFFTDEKIIKNRYERSKGSLKGLCPEIEAVKGNFYSYKKVDGQTLYTVLNNHKIVKDFFEWSRSNLWKKIELTEDEKKEFDTACHKFYYDKTMNRMKMFYDKTGIQDKPGNINGILVPSATELLDKIDWNHIVSGTPSHFHGDLQFDNVLAVKNKNNNNEKQGFVLLDWRQDFGGLIKTGDMYYDLAKLYGGMILPYQLIKKGMFSFEMSGDDVYYDFFLKNELMETRELYESFLIKSGFDLNKIKTITGLIFLNMSPLHKDPFDLMLYYMGRNMLNKILKDV
ncbi:NDP-sugar synthase [Patescibacteria group bacterium]